MDWSKGWSEEDKEVQLVIAGERGKLGYEVATTDIDGGRQRRLTENDQFEHYPTWSPDGTRIAFVASWRDARFGSYKGNDYDKQLARLYVMDVGGSDVATPVTPQTIGVALYPPAWSPDGQRLAFIVDEGESRCCSDKRALYTVRDDGEELHRIGEATTLPTWSPSGDLLAFSNTDGEVSAIYTAKPDGTGRRQVWSGEFRRPITKVSWSPDGAEILVVSSWLWTVRPDGSGSRVLGSSYLPIRLVDAAWSPDGSRIAARGMRGLLDELRILSMSRDGSDVKLLVAEDREVGRDDSEIYAWSSPLPETPVDLSSCSAGTVVPKPEENQGLVRDCEVLLAIRDKLAGRASLKWDAGARIWNWQGVGVKGARVERLSLGAAGLTGYLPSELGQLSELRVLTLSSGLTVDSPNELSGVIPPELENLTKLEVLRLHGNFLSGPVPVELWNLTGLRELLLGGTFLTGCIPEGLSHLMDEYTGLETCIATEQRSP